VEHISGPISFFVYGIGLEVAAFTALILWFRRSGWMGNEGEPDKEPRSVGEK